MDVHTLLFIAQIMGLVSLVAFIWLVVLAFKRRLWWGVGVLLLSPITATIFALKYWDTAKKPFVAHITTFFAGMAIAVYVFTTWGGWNFVTTVVTTISRSASEQRPITAEEDLEVRRSLLAFLENAPEREEDRQTIATMRQLLERGGSGFTKEEQIEILYDFVNLMEEYGFPVDVDEWQQAGQVRGRETHHASKKNQDIAQEDVLASIRETAAAPEQPQEMDAGTPRGTRNPSPEGPQYKVISFAEAKDYIGARVILAGRNGLEQEGNLIDVSGTMLRFETFMSGGRMSFEFKKEQIESLKVLVE